MTAQGILVVPPGWHEGDAATMDKTTALHHQDAFEVGTRLLFYMKEPVDAIIGEGEATGDVFQQDAEEPQAGDVATPVASTGIDQRTYELPYQLVRNQVNTPPISLSTIQSIVGSDFSVFDEEWIPLTDEQYQALIQEWERNTP